MIELEMKRPMRSGEALAGYLNVIPSAVSIEAMVAAGADCINIDQEHGADGARSSRLRAGARART